MGNEKKLWFHNFFEIIAIMPVLNCEMFEKSPTTMATYTDLFSNGISQAPSCGQKSHITHL